MVTERDTCRVEDRVKIYGIGSIKVREEKYSAERIQWAMHFFGREKRDEKKEETAERREKREESYEN